MTDRSHPLEGLNEAQREAVLATEGPLLILAGAGSGKTRVITHRVAHLVAEGLALPRQIIAVTFTNKAAGEMRERVGRLLGAEAEEARIGTFHALCLRILRREGRRIGLPDNFQVFDTADQLGVLRTVMKELGIDESESPPRSVLSAISQAKNRLQTSEEFAAAAVLPAARTVAVCYEHYQKRLRQAGGLDFDDLIMETLRLLETDPQAGERYARGCRYLLVDEYQDTNHSQYRLIRALASAHRNVCCVGDTDQSIYRFRGADINNILDFESDYPDARIVKLERNYRSTRSILKAAGAVISKNRRRHPTTLWTENETGQPVHYHRARDDRDEAEAVVRIIGSLGTDHPAGEIAVLYRTNNQSRLIEEALVQAGVRYRIIGSLRFYERKEIKDLLAYLRLLVAPGDDVSFLRAVNTPARGIGKSTLDRIAAQAAEERVPLIQAAERALRRGDLPPRAATAVRSFLAVLEMLRTDAGLGPAESLGNLPAAGHEPGPDPAARAETPAAAAPRAPGAGAAKLAGSPAADPGIGWGPGEGADGAFEEPEPATGGRPIVPLITTLLAAIGFREHLEKSHPGDKEDRLENVEALVSAAAEYDEQQPGGGLQGFLDRSSLRGDTDDVQGDTGVTLLTVHSAKGLEFSAVVLAGLEENLFPHFRSRESGEELEEERRLCYVALTRAKKRLVLTNAFMRRSFGDFVENPPSRFLEELPKDLLVYSESSPWAGTPPDPLAEGGTMPQRVRLEARTATLSRQAQAAGGGYRGRSRPGPRPSPADGDDFAPGRTITHPMFGRGTILSREGSGETLKLTIRFLDAGTKKILPRHTTLVVHD